MIISHSDRRERELSISLSQEHSWDCVLGQRPVRLGFMSHPPGSEKVLGKVSSLASLCLSPCCLHTNTRLFGCVRACCWGRVSLSDSSCVEICCGGTGIRTTVSPPHPSSPPLEFIFPLRRNSAVLRRRRGRSWASSSTAPSSR